MINRLFRVVCVLGIILTAGVARAGSLPRELEPVLAPWGEGVGVVIRHVERQETFVWQADRLYPAGDVGSLFVAAAVQHAAAGQRLSLATHVTLKTSDKVGGPGVLRPYFSDGTALSLRDATRITLGESDRTAVNLLMGKLAPADMTTALRKLEFAKTSVDHPWPCTDPEGVKGDIVRTTPGELAMLLEQLHGRRLISPAVSHSLCGDWRLGRDGAHLPLVPGEWSDMLVKYGQPGSPPGVAAVLHGSTGTILVAVLAEPVAAEKRPDLDRLMRNVVRRAVDHYRPERNALPKEAQLPDEIEMGARGALVEVLQRSLNRRIRPSARLTVDGDFGPSTRTAVQRFQRENQLPATGVVGRETWALLQPLALANEPEQPSDPEAVNAESLPKLPPDTPDGPPVVTANAWAIGDGRTGRMLHGQNAAARREFASTTKIMTAVVVLKEAANRPELLGERVTISEEADRTTGTTATIRTGESYTVEQLLYGLMLPSGNDAAVALSEFIGSRLPAPNATPGGSNDAVARFILRMNQVAAELEMTDTRYMNPHGLPDKDHLSSAQDQLRLAAHAMTYPLLRQIVQTRQYACQPLDPGKPPRTVVWKNTNRLLEITGYEGLKTGTTEAAGACLVSWCERDGEPLIVVVLGSANSESRYVDTRNLFRWSWRAPKGLRAEP